MGGEVDFEMPEGKTRIEDSTEWRRAFKDLKEDISEIKVTIREDVKEPLKQLTEVVSKIGIQEERMAGIVDRVGTLERSNDKLWTFVREWHDQCITRQALVPGMPEHPGQWWNNKVACTMYKVFWLAVSALIGLAIGRAYL